MKIGYQILL